MKNIISKVSGFFARVNRFFKSTKVLRVVVVVLTITLLVSLSVAICSCYEPNYKKYADKLDVIQVYDSDELTDKIVSTSHKNGQILIERRISKCISVDDKIGVDLYTEDSVDLSGVDGLSKGSIVVSYYIYEPDSPNEGFCEQFNYILEQQKE